MRLLYEGTDITGDVDVHACEHRDVAGGRCDCLDITLENAEKWLRWKPRQDDAIEAVAGQYTTGTLYLNAILPEGDRFRVMATSLKSAAKRKAWQSFRNAKLKDLFASCAAQCGMDWRAYGLDENAVYPYIERENEGCAAFLCRLTRLEGAMLKTVCGRLTGIGIEYAQGISAVHNIRLGTNQRGAERSVRENAKYAAVTVKTPYAEATAVDDGATQQERATYTNLPAASKAQAGRWARGLLITNNRLAEKLTIHSDFNPGMTAMARVDITSDTDENGEWIADAATHDLVNLRTTVELLRKITTIR